jgi:hypothetical protein
LTPEDGEHPKTEPELIKLLAAAIEGSADLMEEPPTVGRAQSPIDRLLEKKNADGTESCGSGSLEELIGAVVQMQVLVQTYGNAEARR